MKKQLYMMLIGASLPASVMAQSAIDAMQITQSDFKGTARFMSMGGAFTALGGDLSTLSQNPAGIGIYRSSEIGVTMDIDMQHTKTPLLDPYFPNTASQTKVYCNNFGYVGATRLDGALRTFNWGVTYGRAASFDRFYQGYIPQISSSLTNYIAARADGYSAYDLGSDDWDKYNPYLDSDCDWLSILGYNSWLISPVGTMPNGGDIFEGIYGNSTTSDALISVREKGYVDQYDISFGGNVEDVVYWGLSIGITDLNYKRWTYYSENMDGATVPYKDGMTDGAFAYDLQNFKNIEGAGWNIKAGVILKPINELRIGLAVHTPTFYKLNQTYYGSVDYTYTPEGTKDTTTGYEYTDDAYFDWKLNAPWKLMVGVAGVIGNRAILSADYEFAGFNSMSTKTPYGYDNWGGYDYVTDEALNNDISTYMKNQNTIRLGAEYRVTPQLSVRAGYNYQMSNVKNQASKGRVEIATAGTDPSFSFDNHTDYITCGLGYRYQSWYIDAAYVYKNRESTYHAFSNWTMDTDKGPMTQVAPQMKVTDSNSSIILTTGFKF